MATLAIRILWFSNDSRPLRRLLNLRVGGRRRAGIRGERSGQREGT
jgi:hypothetical protein